MRTPRDACDCRHTDSRTITGRAATPEGQQPNDTYHPDADRYDGRMPYRAVGRSGLKLPAISLGLWHNFGDDTPVRPASGPSCAAPSTSASPTSTWPTTTARPTARPRPTSAATAARGLPPYRDELVISTKAGWDMWPGPYGDLGGRASTCWPPWTSRCSGWAWTTSTSSTTTASTRTRRWRRRWARWTPPSGRARRSTSGISSYSGRADPGGGRDPARAGHAAADPPAVLLDAQPLDRGGPARRLGDAGRRRASPSRRWPRACSPTSTSTACPEGSRAVAGQVAVARPAHRGEPRPTSAALNDDRRRRAARPWPSWRWPGCCATSGSPRR